MASMPGERTRLVGRLAGAEAGQRLPVLRIVARAADGALLAEGFSSPDGDLALDLPLAGPGGADFRMPVSVQAIDGEGTTVGEVAVEAGPGEQVAVTLDAPGARDAPAALAPVAALPLVNPAAASMLRERIAAAAAAGELPAAAVAMLEGALQPLEWLAGRQSEAEAALRGDPDAAERLRAGLLGWSGRLPADTAPAAEGGDDGPDVAERAGLLDADGLLPVAMAAVHIAADAAEGQLLLDAVAAAAWSRPWVALLDEAARRGDPVSMQTLMGAPGSLPGLPGGGHPEPGEGGPGSGLPGGPGNWSHVPGRKVGPAIRVGPTVADLVPFFRAPINLPPSARERCLIGAVTEVYLLTQALPHWHIQALDNPRACAGQLLTIRGVNFGAAGTVVFPGVPPVAAQEWTDTTIRVVVPPGAAPGRIGLSIFATLLRRCGKDFFVYRTGDSAVDFTGGIPRILSLWVDGVAGDTSAEPGATVSVWFDTSTGAAVTTALTVTDPGGALVFATPALPGGPHTVTFTAPPAPTGPVDLVVAVRAVGECDAAVRSVTLTITRQPDLKILQWEVTQGIQRLDNGVRLAARRRTLVRLYLDNGLSAFRGFSYTGNPYELPGVTGSITLWRGAQKVAVVPPTPAMITSKVFFQPGGRQTIGLSLNFWLPVELLAGPMRLEMRVWLAPPLPHGVLEGPRTSDEKSQNVDFETTNHVRIVQVLLRDDSVAPPLPAPMPSAFSAALAGAQARLPFPDDGYEIYLPPGPPVIGTNHDLTTVDGWEFVLEDLDDIAEDTTNAWNYAWVGLIAAQRPASPNRKLNGIGRRGDGEHDYPAMVSTAGLAATFAHELVHVFGFGHAGCPLFGDNVPTGIDPSLPAAIEDVGIDLLTTQVYPSGSGELMSYCGGENRWISIALWTKLMDLLKV